MSSNTSRLRAVVAALAAAATAALALAACGGSTTTAGTAADATSSAAPSATTTTTAPTTTVTTTPASSATPQSSSSASGPPPCTATDLALSFLGQQGATNHGELGFAIRNTGTASCSTIGYPGIQFLDKNGASLPTAPVHTTSDFFGRVPLRSLTIAPGESASFRVGVTHGAASAVGCTTAYGIQVIAPNDTATIRLTLPMGAFECVTATVSPMAAGDSAYPVG